jgi:predicted nucleotidyltransferase
MPYLSEKEMKVVKAFCADVRKTLGDNVVSITLFGSRARGEGTEESDIDVLILLEESNLETDWRISEITADYMLEYDIPLSPIIFTEEEWSTNKKRGSFFVESVEKEGVLS